MKSDSFGEECFPVAAAPVPTESADVCFLVLFCAIYAESKGNWNWTEKPLLNFFVNCTALRLTFSSGPVIPCLLGKEWRGE